MSSRGSLCSWYNDDKYSISDSEQGNDSTPASSITDLDSKTRDSNGRESCDSIATYASTTFFTEEDETLQEDISTEIPWVANRSLWHESPYQHSEDENQQNWTLLRMVAGARPATTEDFASLFPSSRNLYIHHDDSTLDGNMNLRVDAWNNLPNGKQIMTTLFHLRMHDLRKRQFSLRRYSRRSGREVCSSSVGKARAPVTQETESSLKPSVSSLLSSFGSKQQSRNKHRSHSWRNSSTQSVSEARIMYNREAVPIMPNTIKLEFSNYASIAMTCTKSLRTSGRYDYEYWGVDYQWQRKTRRISDGEEIEFNLVRKGERFPAARIVPLPMTQAEIAEETWKGGWIPPCVLCISDPKLIEAAADVAEAIVGTGLTALVNDRIRQRFNA